MLDVGPVKISETYGIGDCALARLRIPILSQFSVAQHLDIMIYNLEEKRHEPVKQRV